MNIYTNPPLIIRLAVIAGGLTCCVVAGAAQSIIFLFVGLGIAVFGVAWGDKAYLGVLWTGITATISFIKNLIFRSK